MMSTYDLSALRPGDSFGPPRNREGCYTCRIRKKRCDGAIDEQGTTCGECVRLGIDCLGWGDRRPDWTKDKAALEDFKNRIKRQLMSRSNKRSSPGTPSSQGFSSSPVAMLGPSESSSHSGSHHDSSRMSGGLLQIAISSGVPAHFTQFIMNIDELAHWKQKRQDYGCLSYRELARRGRAIEDMLLGIQDSSMDGFSGQREPSWVEPRVELLGDSGNHIKPLDLSWSEANNHDLAKNPSTVLLPHLYHQDQPGLLYPNNIGHKNMATETGSVVSYTSEAQVPTSYNNQASCDPFSSGESLLSMHPFSSQGSLSSAVASSVASVSISGRELIFKEACLLLLHAVISGPNPKVEEIESSVRNLATRLSALSANELTSDLAFPACAAACMGYPHEREFFYSVIASAGHPEVQHAARALIQEVAAYQDRQSF